MVNVFSILVREQHWSEHSILWQFYSEEDAQASIYHVSWQKNYGFCCVIEEECARELLGECDITKCEGVFFRK